MVARHYTLDYLRAVSALVVVFGHFEILPNTEQIMFAYSAVMLFFIISGYSITLSNSDSKSFY